MITTHAIHVTTMAKLTQELARLQWHRQRRLLIQLFSDQLSAAEAQQWASQILGLYPHATLVGMSSCEQIRRGQLCSGGTLLLLSRFDSTDLQSVLKPLKHRSYAEGLQLAEPFTVSDRPNVLLLFTHGLDGGDQVVLDGIHHGLPDTHLAGGTAYRRHQPEQAWVLCGDSVHQDALVAVGLHNPELAVHHDAFSEWFPIGRTLTVTYAEGSRLYQLDGRPCADIYRHYLTRGDQLDEQICYEFPLILSSSPNKTLCSPMTLHEDGSLSMRVPLQIGDQVQFAYTHPAMSAEQLTRDVRQLHAQPVETLFIYNCYARNALAMGQTEQEFAPLQAIHDSHGVFCGGETYGTGQKRLLHHSLTFLALSESPRTANMEQPAERPDPGRSLVPIFNLIEAAQQDLEQQNRNLEARVQEKTEQLEHLYLHDVLTRLPNRSALLRDDRQQPLQQLIVFKVANFSSYNECYGYSAGDYLLRQLSHYLRRQLDDNEMRLYRIGINEFAIAVHTAGPQSDVVKHMETLLDAIQQRPFDLPQRGHRSQVVLSLVAGMASRHSLDGNISQLLIRASEMRRKAEQDKVRFRIADKHSSLPSQKEQNLMWLQRVQKALRDDRIVPFVQPIYDTEFGDIASYECLVRLVGEEGEIYTPGYFLELIRTTQLYPQVSVRMLDKCAAAFAGNHLEFSVNLTVGEIHNPAIRQHIAGLVSRHNLQQRLMIELLESESVPDYQVLAKDIAELRRIGCRIAIDDFGSGYSNIMTVMQIKPDVIKIDGSLIKDIHNDAAAAAMVTTIISGAKALGALTVAEFVHCEEIKLMLEEMGVDRMQGFHLAEPDFIECWI